MLRDWLAAAFLWSVLRIVLRLVSVAVLWFVRFACCWLCSSLACRWLCSCLACRWPCSCLACRWLCSSQFFSSLLQIFVVLVAVFVPELLYFTLLATGSLTVVPSVILLLLLQSHFVVDYDSVVHFDPREGSLQQHVLLFGRVVASAARRCSRVHLHKEGFPRGLLSRRGSSNTAGWSSILASLSVVFEFRQSCIPLRRQVTQ